MGGTITTGGLIQGQDSQNCWIDYPGTAQTVYYPYQQVFSSPPSICSGDVHVFPCPHCDKCKCGQATVKRDKRGKDGR